MKTSNFVGHSVNAVHFLYIQIRTKNVSVDEPQHYKSGVSSLPSQRQGS